MLDQLQKNIKILISKYESEKSRADKLEAELEKYKRNSENADNKIKELEDKVDSLSLQSAFSPIEGGNKDAKIKIDKLIKEIDEALALLR